MMQLKNWRSVAKHIACYDDVVLLEAQRMANHLFQRNSYGFDTQPLKAALSQDSEQLGLDWQRECYCNARIAQAIEDYADERHRDALATLIPAMIIRSSAWEQTFC
jgi:hypothetical protein